MFQSGCIELDLTVCPRTSPHISPSTLSFPPHSICASPPHLRTLLRTPPTHFTPHALLPSSFATSYRHLSHLGATSYSFCAAFLVPLSAQHSLLSACHFLSTSSSNFSAHFVLFALFYRFALFFLFSSFPPPLFLFLFVCTPCPLFTLSFLPK